jgi:hypothetical protein
VTGLKSVRVLLATTCGPDLETKRAHVLLYYVPVPDYRSSVLRNSVLKPVCIHQHSCQARPMCSLGPHHPVSCTYSASYIYTAYAQHRVQPAYTAVNTTHGYLETSVPGAIIRYFYIFSRTRFFELAILKFDLNLGLNFDPDFDLSFDLNFELNFLTYLHPVTELKPGGSSVRSDQPELGNDPKLGNHLADGDKSTLGKPGFFSNSRNNPKVVKTAALNLTYNLCNNPSYGNITAPRNDRDPGDTPTYDTCYGPKL